MATDQDIANQLNIPNGAPSEAIVAFIRACQTGSGDSKDKNMHREMKKRAQEAIMNYMDANDYKFIQVNDQYLVISDKNKPCGWSDELVMKAFVEFDRRGGSQGPIANRAVAFVEFCRKVREHGGETIRTLSFKRKRPLAATLQELTNMGNI